MKARMTVDPRLLKLLGDKLYSSHSLPIVVRELLQNSRDACLRKGVKPDIRIAIDVKGDGNSEVSCTDNGIGMTEEQLIDDFLCLGNTSKSKDEQAVGGFGIAKAALMRNPYWSVYSLDNYFDSDMLMAGEDIKKVEKFNGTTVRVKITDPVGRNAFDKALLMIYLSDVKVNLITDYRGDVFEDTTSWRGGVKKELEGNANWRGLKFDPCKISKHDISVEKYNVFRLNGLVQFIYSSWGDREYNLLFELYPKCRPEDKEYPLTMSREELAGSVKREIQELIDNANSNPVTTGLDKTDEDNVKLTPGFLQRGKRGSDRLRPYYDDLNPEPSIEELREDGQKYDRIALLFQEYDPNERHFSLKRDSKLLTVWYKILCEVTDCNEAFGIGLTANMHVNAARINYYTDKGTVDFYTFNPDTIHEHISLEAQIHFMHHLACHEAAHFKWYNHGEHHSIEETTIYKDTIDAIQHQMTELKQILR